MKTKEVKRLEKIDTSGCGITAGSLSSNPGEGGIGSVGEGLVALVLVYDAIV